MEHGPGTESARSPRRAPSHGLGDPRVAALLQLQRSVGNAAVGRALRQMTAPRVDAIAPPPVEAAHDHPICLQRHSSFEHKMLGDINPKTLQVITKVNEFEGTGKPFTERKV